MYSVFAHCHDSYYLVCDFLKEFLQAIILQPVFDNAKIMTLFDIIPIRKFHTGADKNMHFLDDSQQFGVYWATSPSP